MKKLLGIVLLGFALNSSQINYSYSGCEYWERCGLNRSMKILKSTSEGNERRKNTKRHKELLKEIEDLKDQITTHKTLTYVNDDKYVGEYKYGKRNGQGIYTYADGDKYDGQWKDGNEHGQGTFTFDNGNKYDGQWKDGNEHGKGTFTFADKEKGKVIGEWIDGKYQNNREYETSSPHWSLAKKGPTTLNETIDMFFKDRQLDPIEGVWIDEDWGMIAITRSGPIYKTYYVNVNIPEENGTWGASLTKTIDSKIFDLNNRITWSKKDGSGFKYATSPGTMVLENNDYLKSELYKFAKHPVSWLTRKWPTNLIEWNNSNKNKQIITDKNYDSGDFTEKLKTLNELYKSGALTKSEFTKAKKKLLN